RRGVAGDVVTWLTTLCLSWPLARVCSRAFLFFHGSGAHRDLHSFPTRRSSDLGLQAGHGEHRRRAAVLARAGFVLRPAARGRQRSEEHTSELQSRENLVCRLLLEKKKNANA